MKPKKISLILQTHSFPLRSLVKEEALRGNKIWGLRKL